MTKGSADDRARERGEMVERQLRRRGISDQRVLDAMASVPREDFLAADGAADAYADRALRIGFGQTISQPWIVAAICQALELEGNERVLEIGTGSGYSAAVLARLASSVVSVERIPELAEAAAGALAATGFEQVEVVVGDGSKGHIAGAPYDAIAVHAAAPAAPRSLIEQLAPGGRLVVPVAEGTSDALLRIERDPKTSELTTTRLAPTRFVPLIGDEGYQE